MPKAYQQYIWVCLIFLSALLLRLFALGAVPQGLTPDEAAQGYSAYSILKTGADEWGNPYPLAAFKSFLDYKAPLLTYAMVPSIAVFGLNEFAIRLPGAIIGALAVIPLYFLTNLLFSLTTNYHLLTTNYQLLTTNSKHNLGLLAALLLAISPWHLQFSRMALEANIISFLFPLSLYFIIKGLKDTKFFILAALSVSVSLYSYHAAKVFVPLFAAAFVLVYLSEFKKILIDKSKLITLVASLILGLVLILPILLDTVIGGAGSRSELAITNLNHKQLEEISFLQYYSPLNRITTNLPRVFHNKLSFALDSFITNYIGYFSLDFWFAKGGWETTYSILPDRGLLYLWQLPFFLVGLAYLLKNLVTAESKTLLAWMLLAPIPAALTKESYRPNRASTFLCFFELIIALGVVVTYSYTKKYKKIFITAVSGILVVSLVFYANDYLLASEIRYPKAMNAGWREVYAQITPIESNYEHVLVKRGDQSQIFTAFYKALPPQQYQQAAKSWQNKINSQPDITYLDQMGEYQLGKYIYKNPSWPEDIHPDWLYVIKDPIIETLPKNRTVLYSKYTNDHQPMFEIFKISQ